MASWHSIPLQVLYQVLGWLTFISWAISCYPQIILNFRRKSVVGLNLDYKLLNLTKQTSYLIYNASLYFSTVVQKQYLEKYGFGQMIPVATNDVAFSAHNVIMTLVVLFQVAIYERGGQKFSKSAIATVSVIWLIATVCFFVALPDHSWLWLISIFNSIQVCMTLIKYMPQALTNFLRKSTDGFSIGGVLLDFSGGVFNYSQMAVQSIDQGSWVNFSGNVGKVLLSLVTIFYDLLFMFQHYVLYPGKKAGTWPKANEKIREPLICPTSIDVTNQQIKGLKKSSDLSLPQEILNLTKHTSYLIYNASLYFSTVIQKQYFDKYGSGQMIPAAANDVTFSTHSVIMTLIVLFQVAIYERGGQKFSKSAIATVSLIWLIAAVCFFVALSNHSWLWLISIFNSIQVCMTLIKYMPQAIMNFLRKSTDGFSIGGVLLDFSGVVFNYSQMAVQSIDQGSWVNFFGNVGKVLVSLVTIFYDSVFMFQHYVRYLGKKTGVGAKGHGKMREPLISPNLIDVTDQQIKDLQKSCDRPLPQEEV